MCPFSLPNHEWMTFWDSYDSAIYANAGLMDINKFNYLRRSLLWRSCLWTDADRGEVIAVIKCRFGNKQQIISRHMDVLITLPAVVNKRFDDSTT